MLSNQSGLFGKAKQKRFAAKKMLEQLFGTLNWLYEHSPINFATMTGIWHPSIQHVKGHPIYGSAIDILKNKAGYLDLLKKNLSAVLSDRKGRSYMSMGPEPFIMLTEPADIAQLFVFQREHLDRMPALEAFRFLVTDQTVFTLPDGEEQTKKRKLLMSQIFKSTAVESLIPDMQNIIDDFVVKIQKEGNVASLEKFTTQLTMEVFSRLMLNAPINDGFEKVSGAFTKALGEIGLPKNNTLLRLAKTIKFIGKGVAEKLTNERNNLCQVISDNVIQPNLNRIQVHAALLDDYKIKYSQNSNVVHDDMMMQFIVLLLAGHETTANLLHFATILLHQHPEILAKARAEIAANQAEDGQWTAESLKKLSYLGKIIKETLRLYPPFPLIPRTIMKKIVLADIPLCHTPQQYEEAMKTRDRRKDIILSAGTTLLVSPWLTHRLDKFYPDPLSFNPDRFASDTVDVDYGYTWIPFGVGHRNCPGRRFAMQETKLYLANLIANNDFNLKCETNPLLETVIQSTLRHQGTVEMDIRPRMN